jgi:hypothetical protein
MKKQRKKRARRRRAELERRHAAIGLKWLLEMVKQGGVATGHDDLVGATMLAVRAIQGVASGARRASKSLRRFMEVAGGRDLGWHHRAIAECLTEGRQMRMDIPASALRGITRRANAEDDEAFRERIRARLRERMIAATPFQRVRVDDDGAHDYEPDGDTVSIFRDGARPVETTITIPARSELATGLAQESIWYLRNKADAAVLPRPIQVGQLDALTKGDNDGNE